MIKLGHVESLSILALTAVFAYTGCAIADLNEEDPTAGDVAEGNTGETEEGLVFSCSNVSNAKWPDAWETLEQQVRNKVNQVRKSGTYCRGVWKPPVAALTNNSKLTCAARSHSKDLAEKNLAASHTGSDGTDPYTRMTQAGYTWHVAGENAGGGQKTADGIVNSWVKSKTGHCEVLMKPAFTEFGIGYYYKSTTTNQVRWTMDLAKPLTVTPCPHDKCKTGVKLASTCNSCVAKICAKDPFCCNGYWDAQCVAKVSSVCGQTCR